MLGSNGEDRVFYRILVDGETLTGYDDLPLPEGEVTMLVPRHYTRPFRDTEVRIAAVQQTILSGGRPAQVMVLVAQTRLGQASIAAFLANQAAALGLGFFVVAALLALLAAGIGLRPLGELAAAVGRRRAVTAVALDLFSGGGTPARYRHGRASAPRRLPAPHRIASAHVGGQPAALPGTADPRRAR